MTTCGLARCPGDDQLPPRLLLPRFVAEGYGSFEVETTSQNAAIADIDLATVQHISGCTVRAAAWRAPTATAFLGSGTNKSVCPSVCEGMMR
jgi:hypothetical protein